MTKPTVLFVDDERDVLDSIKDALRKKPYRILTATSGEAALALLDRHAISVVVSDEQMPEMNGHELLARVCGEHPDTVRIMLTGQASMEATIAAINEGQVYRFLSKPCSPAVLDANIQAALELGAGRSSCDKALHSVRGRQAAKSKLEQDFPGITQVNRSPSGAIRLEETPSQAPCSKLEWLGID